MKNKLPFLVIICILVGFYFLLSQKPASISSLDSDFVLFYSNTCPHCLVVEEYISTNQIDKKLNISQLEVRDNQSNSSLFNNLVKNICPDQLNSSGLPVPFLIDQKDKKCTVGDTPIINYLVEKTKFF